MKLSAAAHKRTATIPPSQGHPEGRFPVPDRNHARLALAMLGRAKGMSAGQKAAVRAAAERRLAS